MTISNQASGIRPGVCSSTTRPTAPFTGQIIYETDTGYLRVWDGSNWDYLSQKQDTAEALPAETYMGLVKVIPTSVAGTGVSLSATGTVTFTTATSVTVNNCFSSLYENYRVVMYWTQNTSTANTNLKLRDGSGDISANYGMSAGGYFASSGTMTFAGFNVSADEAATQAFVMGGTAGASVSFIADVFTPNLARDTNFIGTATSSAYNVTLTRVNVATHIRHTASTACTGFSLLAAGGSITGSLRVYGYRN